jgi:carboxylate-amine ligase
MSPRSPIAQRDKPVFDAAVLRERCAATQPLLIGLEEELMLLDAETLDLAPRAPQLLARLDGDPRFKLELPAAQIELITSPEASVPAAVEQLARARAQLETAATPDLRLAGAGVHPFAAARGAVNRGERYDATLAEYGPIAERQLVFGLHVHVAVDDADRAVAVHDALRSYLPEIAALAANAPFYEGADSGLASVRPKVSELLPRQGVPPVIGSLEAYAEELAWGARSGAVPHPRRWWWGLRLHPEIGTIEVRIPDTQATIAETAGVAALVHALVADLLARHADGEALEVAPTWRIDANRWSACRYGVSGEMADLCSGEREPTAERLLRLLDELSACARPLGCARALDTAREMIEAGGPAAAQRRLAARGDLRDVVRGLADRFGDRSR